MASKKDFSSLVIAYTQISSNFMILSKRSYCLKYNICRIYKEFKHADMITMYLIENEYV